MENCDVKIDDNIFSKVDYFLMTYLASRAIFFWRRTNMASGT